MQGPPQGRPEVRGLGRGDANGTSTVRRPACGLEFIPLDQYSRVRLVRSTTDTSGHVINKSHTGGPPTWWPGGQGWWAQFG